MKCCYLYGPMIMSWMPQKYFKLKLLLWTTTEPSRMVHYSGVPNSWGNTCSLWYENECSKSACVAHSSTPSGYACAKRLSKEGPKLSPHAVWVSQLIKRAKHSFRTKKKSTTSKVLPQPKAQRTRRTRMNKVRLRMPNIWQSKLIKEKKAPQEEKVHCLRTELCLKSSMINCQDCTFLLSWAVSQYSIGHSQLQQPHNPAPLWLKSGPNFRAGWGPVIKLSVISEQFLQSLVAISQSLRFDLIKVWQDVNSNGLNSAVA